MRGVIVIEYDMDVDGPENPFQEAMRHLQEHLTGDLAKPVQVMAAINEDADAVVDVLRHDP